MHLAFREQKTSIKGDLNYKGVECAPQHYNLTNLMASPDRRWPTQADPLQIQYQNNLQHSLGEKKISITFDKIESFRVEAADRRLYKLPIPTPVKIANCSD